MGFRKNYIDDSDRNVIDEMDDAVVDDSKNTELRDLYKSDNYYDPSRYGDISNRHMCDEGEHDHDISEGKYKKPDIDEPEYSDDDIDYDGEDDDDDYYEYSDEINSVEKDVERIDSDVEKTNSEVEEITAQLEKLRKAAEANSSDASLKAELKVGEFVEKINKAENKVKGLNMPGNYETDKNSGNFDVNKLKQSKKFSTGILLFAIGLFMAVYALSIVGIIMALKSYCDYNKDSEDEGVKKALAVSRMIIVILVIMLIALILSFIRSHSYMISNISELLR